MGNFLRAQKFQRRLQAPLSLSPHSVFSAAAGMCLCVFLRVCESGLIVCNLSLISAGPQRSSSPTVPHTPRQTPTFKSVPSNELISAASAELSKPRVVFAERRVDSQLHRNACVKTAEVPEIHSQRHEEHSPTRLSNLVERTASQ